MNMKPRVSPEKLADYLQSEKDKILSEMKNPNHWKRNEEFFSMTVMTNERRDQETC